MFKEVSAKSGDNIQEFFKEIAAQLPDVNEPTSRSRAVDTTSKEEMPSNMTHQNIVLTKPEQPEKH
jgi:hypothetical protein